jgi:hypothetical protein
MLSSSGVSALHAFFASMPARWIWTAVSERNAESRSAAERASPERVSFRVSMHARGASPAPRAARKRCNTFLYLEAQERLRGAAFGSREVQTMRLHFLYRCPSTSVRARS